MKLTVAQTAEKYGVTSVAVRHWLNKGLKFETEKAWGVSTGDKDKETGKDKIVWLPKSQCENNNDGTFTMHEWLAKDKGLI